MSSVPFLIRRPFLAFFAAAWLLLAWPAVSVRAQDAGGTETPVAPQQSAMVALINKLAERGALTKQDALELVAQANADAADGRVQAAEALLAAAKADAAVARAQAAAAKATTAMARAQEAAGQAALARASIAKFSAAQIAAAKIVLGLSPSAPVTSDTTSVPVAQVLVPQVAVGPGVPDAVASAAPIASALDPSPPSSANAEPVASTEAPPAAVAAAPLPIPDASPASAAGAVVEGAPTAMPDSSPAAAANGSGTDQALRVADVLNGTAPGESAAPLGDLASAGGQGGHAVRVSDALGETTPAAAEPALADGSSSPAAAQTSSPVDGGQTIADGTAQPVGGPAPARVEDVTPAGDSRTADSSAQDGTIRVAYVPEVVRNQIAAQVKSEVIAQAHQEGWGEKVPEWVTRFTLYGEVRIRIEDIINHSNNNDTGAFPNFNAINTGAPFDTAGTIFSPQFNVDQNRERERLRARLGAEIDLKDGFTAGIRIATGNDNNPVTENQTFGAAGNAQGGDFSKYSVWLDRGYIKYQGPGDSASSFSMTLGRFENPFFGTNLVWANDLGFDGAVLKIPLKARVDGETVQSLKPFLVAGIFPVFNTDLNFASNQPAKYPSRDKWLEAIQAGVEWKMGDNFNFKSAVALYYYKNIEGQLSTPFTPQSSSDAGSTDDSRPSFAQNGNTYMALRDIVPGPLNDNGAIDQFQYYGLASPFHDLAFTEEIDFNNFEPVRISLVGEYVKNLGFNAAAVSAVAVNNLGIAPATGGSALFVGGNEGWFINLKLGDTLMDHAGAWNASLGYRRVESDSVVDGFTDSDFGGDLTGTNLKGFTLGASLAVASGVWLEGHWFSASAIAGPVFKNDTIQFDVNARF